MTICTIKLPIHHTAPTFRHQRISVQYLVFWFQEIYLHYSIIRISLWENRYPLLLKLFIYYQTLDFIEFQKYFHYIIFLYIQAQTKYLHGFLLLILSLKCFFFLYLVPRIIEQSITTFCILFIYEYYWMGTKCVLRRLNLVEKGGTKNELGVEKTKSWCNKWLQLWNIITAWMDILIHNSVGLFLLLRILCIML